MWSRPATEVKGREPPTTTLSATRRAPDPLFRPDLDTSRLERERLRSEMHLRKLPAEWTKPSNPANHEQLSPLAAWPSVPKGSARRITKLTQQVVVNTLRVSQ